MGNFQTHLDHSANVRVCRPGAAIFDTFQNIQRIDKYVWLRACPVNFFFSLRNRRIEVSKGPSPINFGFDLCKFKGVRCSVRWTSNQIEESKNQSLGSILYCIHFCSSGHMHALATKSMPRASNCDELRRRSIHDTMYNVSMHKLNYRMWVQLYYCGAG